MPTADKISKSEMKRAIDKAGLTPLEFLMKAMANDKLSIGMRVDAAKAACPYVHPKLSAIDHNAEVTVSHEEALSELD